MPFKYSDLFNFNGATFSEMIRCYRRLAQKFHPDVREASTGEEDEVIRLITMAWTRYKSGNDRKMEKLPIYLKEEDGVERPVIVCANGQDFKDQVSKYFGFNLVDDDQYRSMIKPWAHIVIVRPVEASFQDRNHTDMDFIRSNYLPALRGLNLAQISGITRRFIGGGKRCFRELIKDGEDRVFLAFTGSVTFCIRTGRNIDPESLTFNRFCALLGEINREKFEATGEAVTPSFSKNIIPSRNSPAIFPYYLHHGVHLSWDLTGLNTRLNKRIYFAIKCMDLVLVNGRRMKANRPALKSVAEMDREEKLVSQTFREDLVKFIGINRLQEFERENQAFIAQKSSEFLYTDEIF